MKQFFLLSFLIVLCLRVSAQSPTYLFGFGSVGTANGQFDSPGGITFAANGNAYVTDRTNNRVQVFSPSGIYLTQFGSAGIGPGQLSIPTAIAISPITGDIFVSERSNNRISVFDNSHVFKYSFGSFGTGDGQLNGPIGLALGSSDNVFVVDRGNNRVQKFSKLGDYLDQYGSTGSGVGQFLTPSGIAISPVTGDVYVVDRGNHRIQYFDTTLTSSFEAFGSLGSADGQFDNPTRITISPSGNLSANGQVYVTDLENDRVQVFDPGGGFLFKFGSFGSSAGLFDNPVGIAVNGPRIWVSEAGNNRVQVFYDYTLPVEFLDFEARLINGSVNLSWITAWEINNSHFLVQRHGKTGSWENIARIEGQGTTDEISNYQYVDSAFDQKPATYYYRLQQVDLNGLFSYSSIVEVNVSNSYSAYIRAYPSPTTDFVWVEARLASNAPYQLTISDITGRILYQKKGYSKQEQINIQLDMMSYPGGLYFVSFQSGNQQFTKKIIKE